MILAIPSHCVRPGGGFLQSGSHHSACTNNNAGGPTARSDGTSIAEDMAKAGNRRIHQASSGRAVDCSLESSDTYSRVLTSGEDYFSHTHGAPMSAKHRSAPRTNEVIYRTYRLPATVRTEMADKRKQFGLTVAGFLDRAITHELPQIVADLERLGMPPGTSQQDRPARLPLSDELLAALKRASNKSGIPASRLLVACVSRGSRRKRNWKQC